MKQETKKSADVIGVVQGKGTKVLLPEQWTVVRTYSRSKDEQGKPITADTPGAVKTVVNGKERYTQTVPKMQIRVTTAGLTAQDVTALVKYVSAMMVQRQSGALKDMAIGDIPAEWDIDLHDAFVKWGLPYDESIRENEWGSAPEALKELRRRMKSISLGNGQSYWAAVSAHYGGVTVELATEKADVWSKECDRLLALVAEQGPAL